MSQIDNRIFVKNRHPLQTFSLGLQHVLAMYAGAVIVPLIVGGNLGFSQEQITYLVAIDLFMCGIATLLQVFANRWFGIGMPVVLGCAFQAVTPMIAIGKDFGISYIYGAIIAMGLFVILFGGLFGKLIRLFPPVVTGSVVTIIGVTLIPVAFNDLGGGQGNPDFGSPTNLLLGFGVLVFIVIMNKLSGGFIRAISILLGLVIGTTIASFMGQVDFTPVAEASWFHAVQPFYFGVPKFNMTAILTMIIVAMVGIAESTGVFMALGKIIGRDVDSKDLARGYRAEGLAITIGGIFNAFPYTTYSQNVGLIQMSRVKTRDVIVVAGCLLMLLGLVPKIAALTTLIPKSVLGGAMVAMFGMVVSSGLRMLGSQVDMNRHENLLIIACSVGMGLGVTVVPQLFASLPSTVRILTDNGIVAGTFTAMVLNLLFNGTKQPTSDLQMDEEEISHSAAS
ncbi:nucleobase:cation symporter-2 family protein [Paenibacillus alvei]|uniref:nucleobase:cation symporter-2 family protein n=1 Tax=Paenibacillus alvei TaxID=44250 RepID=UPI0019D5C6CE|nr:nucleobase:cation symporter-2 family protein [Paenibacillus alvei]MBG9733269.1 xanthine permease [Paenibacillus alvei]MBG9745172.1 xanthine permease [Paenibacillus alvei]MCY9580690.1 purine permease [Paenibacillus alvei]MCY9585173.1 purine permease [Paenibacillus alvei]